MKQFISVVEARGLVLANVEPLAAEVVPLHDCGWRVLAADIVATRTQPPFNAAAMDGYALHDADAHEGAELAVIGESAAGRSFNGVVSTGECIRIFTGAPVPSGVTSVVMQEDVSSVAPQRIRIDKPILAGRHIRARGLDFEDGRLLVTRGSLLDSATLSLCAAGGHANLPVVRRPKVAILATGDELVSPGQATGPDQIVASNTYGVAAIARKHGAEILDLGIVQDDKNLIFSTVKRAFDDGADILVTLGGASVGDHDLIKPVLADFGLALGFWQIAMRPGKPLMHARHGMAHVLGLPGNPVSSLVCAHLFLVPLICALSGRKHEPHIIEAVTETAMRENDKREDYVRAFVTKHTDGSHTVRAFDLQDSSMLSTLAASNGLIVREPFAPAASAGDTVKVLMLR
jgi:molybdopterin molybdotransferase